MWEESYNCYVFTRSRKTYIVMEDSEESAWNYLQHKISWNMDLIKEQFKLVKVLNALDKFIKL